MKKILLALCLATPMFAYAGSTTATITVTATVSGVCKITTAPSAMTFTAIDPSVAGIRTASSSFVYKCTNGLTPGTITTDLGMNFVGAQMKMIDGAKLLNYAITSTPSLVAGTGFGAGSTGTTVTVNGAIAEVDAQNAQAGSYSDTVTITVNF